jgi:hypothetical protein
MYDTSRVWDKLIKAFNWQWRRWRLTIHIYHETEHFLSEMEMGILRDNLIHDVGEITPEMVAKSAGHIIPTLKHQGLI